MTISQTRFPRHIEAVFAEDGSFQAGSVMYLVRTVDESGADVAPPKNDGPKPADQSQLVSAFGQANAAIAEQVRSLTAQLATKTSEAATLTEQLATKTSEAATLTEQLSSKSVELVSLQASKEAALAALQTSKESELAALQTSKEEAIASLQTSKEEAIASLQASKDQTIAELQSQVAALTEELNGTTTVNGVPQTVQLWQARAALEDAGLIDQTNAVIAASTDRALKVHWEYGNVLHREDPMIAQLGSAIGLTSEQIDSLFIAASTIAV